MIKLIMAVCLTTLLFIGCDVYVDQIKAAEVYCEKHGGLFKLWVTTFAVDGRCKDGTYFSTLGNFNIN